MKDALLPIEENRVRTMPIALDEPQGNYTMRVAFGRIERSGKTKSMVIDGKVSEVADPPMLQLSGVKREDWEAVKAAVDAAWARWTD
jgi:hypothetical protein